MDNFWFKNYKKIENSIKRFGLSTFFSYKRVGRKIYNLNRVLQQWIKTGYIRNSKKTIGIPEGEH